MYFVEKKHCAQINKLLCVTKYIILINTYQKKYGPRNGFNVHDETFNITNLFKAKY